MDKIKDLTDKVSLMHRLMYVLVYLAMLVLALISTQYFNGLNLLTEDNSIQIESSEFGEAFTPRLVAEGESGFHAYELTLDAEALEDLDGDAFVMFANQVNDNAIRIWFNDRLVLSEGDLAEGYSMIKGSGVYGHVERSAIQAVNTIRVEVYSIYKTGFGTPLIIAEEAVGRRAVKIMIFTQEWLLIIAIGLMAISSVFTLLFYLQNRNGNRILLYLSLLVGLSSIFFQDFLTVRDLSFSYLSFKKVFLVSISMGTVFCGLAIYEIIHKKLLLIPTVAQGIFYLMAAAFSEDMVQFKSLYNIWYLILGFTITLYFLAVLIHAKRSNRAYILMVDFLAVYIYSAIAISAPDGNGYLVLMSPVFYMFSIGMMPLLVSFDMVMMKNVKITKEKELRKKAYTQSLTDDLTGVWNKRYLNDVFLDGEIQSVIAMVDLDNLKAINDTYGHLAGDYILREVAEMVGDSIRHTDEVCRYGGDEFVVLFKGCSTEMAYLILDKIRRRIGDRDFAFGNKKIKTSVSIGLFGSETMASDEMLIKADEGLYKAKVRGKNCIVVV